AATPHGERLARQLQRALPGAGLLQDPHRLPEVFKEGTPVIAFMAVGAAVRLLAPALRDKRSEPPVVAVDDAGRFAVSLVGGRAAGANRLASYVASVLGAQAVVTTAAERLGLPALDEALAELDWRLEAPRALTRLEAAVVRGEEIGFFGPDLEPPAGFGFQVVESADQAAGFALGLAVSDRLLKDLPAGWAVARPGRLVLGFGCSREATAEEARDLALDALRGAELSPSGVRVVATIDRRLDHLAARGLAESLGARLVGFPPAELDAVPVANPSPAVREAVGTASVAEAAALLQSGGRLLVPKRVGGRATVAVAE
ncbi:MAG: cobalamin biosynthesis protein, partial [Candidatus Dormibacteraeota bacterium]|nr:cobalamin biosynthesis protein [Candidatus Dormibacteraeota bacterium]